ncbi:MAG TPA: hypothetical protein VMC62_02065 [Longilinea sp.]|nr:hypothetical protein [Longilinea sp.]
MKKMSAGELQSRAAAAAVVAALGIAESDARQQAAAVAVTSALAAQKSDLKSYAAAVAVAAALAGQAGGVIYVQRPAAPVSAWQLTMRSYQLNLRNQSFNRKPRGNTR